jgi:AcrR family transcriptional regulator
MSLTPTGKSGAKGETSRQTILRAAASLATVDGLEGISIGNLAAQIGMSKSGLYAHFGSKEELQLATVETAAQIFTAEVIEPTQAISDPLERLMALCDSFISHIERRVFPGGCFFASVSAEFDTHPGPVRDKVTETQEAWAAQIEELIREAQTAETLDPAEDPALLAFELNSYLLLGNTNFVLYDDAAYLERTRRAIARLLERARLG